MRDQRDEANIFSVGSQVFADLDLILTLLLRVNPRWITWYNPNIKPGAVFTLPTDHGRKLLLNVKHLPPKFNSGAQYGSFYSLCSVGWWLVLICGEKKLLLADAGLV